MAEFKRTFKIFNYPWHLSHQRELFKMPFLKFGWLRNFKRHYNFDVRNDFVTEYGGEWVNEYDPGKYDVALLHLDQQCFEPGIWDRGKGRMYQDLNEVIKDIPKVVLMHGTPYYPEMFNDTKPVSQELIRRCKLAVGSNTMVVNSHTAAKQWGFGKAIIHGLDGNEWFDRAKEPRVITMISPGGLPMYYDREFLAAVKDELADRGINHCHITVDWGAKNWDDYRNFVGRSLVYFNPTRESPMPRSRTEAMLSGCCVITTPTQDADTFIENGKNGFLVKRDPVEVANLVEWCFANYDEAVAIGQRGKETAQKLFSWERYAQDWYDLLCKVVPEKQ